MNMPAGKQKNPVNDQLKQFKKRLASQREIPLSTYRLQLNKNFSFAEARSVVSYLADLGVSHCYTSPFLEAGKGSPHGYDICNFSRINPELGGDSEYREFINELSLHKMGHILDFVPNHMGIADPKNKWWQDVLENGPCSPYSEFFDIEWNPAKSELKGKILLPILSDQYGVVLERGDLHLNFQGGTFFLKYYEHHLPINPQSVASILAYNLDVLQREVAKEDQNLQEFLGIIHSLHPSPESIATTSETVEDQVREKNLLCNRLDFLWNQSQCIRRHIEENLNTFNGSPGYPESFDRLHKLLEKQFYRLSNWRTAAHEINYRRFFDVNHLAGLRMENPEVFRNTHPLILELIGQGTISGLRLDHTDGLFDPASYFDQLQEEILLERARRNNNFKHLYPLTLKAILRQWREDEANQDALGPVRCPLYLVVEKILTGTESLPNDWAIHGTSGYDFMNDVNGLFVNTCNEKEFSKIYSRFTGITAPFSKIVYESKKLILQTSLTSELNVLVRALNLISEEDRSYRDFTLNSLREALREVVACFPIYRTYIDSEDSNQEDRETLEKSIARAKSLNPTMESTIFDFIKDTVLEKTTEENASQKKGKIRRDFTMQLQQFTGPVQAKGLEDTAFYRYNRLLSLNEVGGQPQRFGLSISRFHARNQKRQKNWPWTMTATATHDHKRGEDVRARLNILSEIPEDWRKAIRRWALLNRSKRSWIDGEYAPDRNDEYLFYQTLLGIWPPGNDSSLEQIKNRMVDYMLKANKEAKIHTSWINPNNAYDEAVKKFVEKALKPSKNNRFLDSFLAFQKRIARMAVVNSLAQVLLKITCPGIPDTYQGCELWDLSLVDPDNRRLVNFERRKKLLQELEPLLAFPSTLNKNDQTGDLQNLLDYWENGHVKMFVAACCMRFRRNHPDLFLNGDYLPLQVEGKRADHVVAFARQNSGKTAIIIAPRLVASLMEPELKWPVNSLWKETHIVLPSAISGKQTFHDLFTRNSVSFTFHEDQMVLELENVLSHWPLALLADDLPAQNQS
ncbi:MAG: maltooligosyl trehalose synthase [Nitrospinaceae bacterium]|nr:MAG: maltooligosyl trehalose synthase [Nitrospinaceae bacterium]